MYTVLVYITLIALVVIAGAALFIAAVILTLAQAGAKVVMDISLRAGEGLMQAMVGFLRSTTAQEIAHAHIGVGERPVSR